VRKFLLLVIAAIGLALPLLALAAAGDLDPSFGTGGKVLTDFAGSSDSVADLVLQPDGKIIAGGKAGPQGALARYNPDGSLDPSFGSGGKLTSDLGVVYALALQPDAKIVSAGSTEAGLAPAGDFALARYNPDGSLDTSFGSGGTVTTDFFGLADAALGAVLIQPDGKIIAVGVAQRGVAANEFALARYNPDGSLDASFGTGGKVTTDFPNQFGSGNAVAGAAILQPDGKIVAGGTAHDMFGQFYDFALARYNPDGSLDASFGAAGRVTTDIGDTDSIASLALQPDGKIVAAGTAFDEDFTIARYNSDGNLDPGFGSGGLAGATFTGLGGEFAADVAIQQNGKIVAVGRAAAFVGSDILFRFALVRLTADGSLDSSFGSGGKLTTDFGAESEAGASAVLIQPDGRIVAGGDSSQGATSEDFALARYLGDAAVTEVAVDIKPGSATNTINLRSHGLVPVAILTTGSFDATTVDPGSVCFGDAGDPAQRDCSEAHGTGHIEDVNGDGRADLLLHFEVDQTGIDAGDTSACLTGETFGGDNVEGCDSITTQ
jgi:uncharacterized delta-60 repeat protein